MTAEDNMIRPTRYTLVEERDDEFIIQSNSGEMDLRAKTPYFILKLKHFNGNRIFHKFSDKIHVEETYSDGIFNCYDSNNKLVQIADKDAIAELIFNKDVKGYIKLVNKWADIKFQEDLIGLFFSEYQDRIWIQPMAKKIVIDSVFSVSYDGNASYWQQGKGWKPLCIVPSTKTHIEGDIGVTLPGGDYTIINKKTLIVFGKIMFLLFPKQDIIFLNQLPTEFKQAVEKRIKKMNGNTEDGTII